MRLLSVVGLALWVSLGFACKGGGTDAKATREDCSKVAEHIAELIITHYSTHPDEWWTAVTSEAGESGIPADVQQGSFKTWLDTPAGKTWVQQRRAYTLTGTQSNIDACVDNASRALTNCLLAAKSKDDVVACDTKHGKKPAGSATTP